MPWQQRETDFASATIGMMIADASPDRAAVYVCNLSVTAGQVTTLQRTGANPGGMAVPAGQNLALYYSRDGGLAQAMLLWGGPNGVPLTIVESLWYPESG
jgi:hypothetical protein